MKEESDPRSSPESLPYTGCIVTFTDISLYAKGILLVILVDVQLVLEHSKKKMQILNSYSSNFVPH